MPTAGFRIGRCEEMLQHSCKAWIPLPEHSVACWAPVEGLKPAAG